VAKEHHLVKHEFRTNLVRTKSNDRESIETTGLKCLEDLTVTDVAFFLDTELGNIL
jgi:hypothetical protein